MPNPTEALGDVFATEIGGYSILQLGVAALGVAVVIGGLRFAYDKAIGKR